MHFDLRKHTILLAICGSRCYGIHRPDSDIDIKGVAIPPKQFFLGSTFRFAQAEGPDNLKCFFPDFSEKEHEVISKSKLEGSIYEIRKFIQLAAECNPNILDVLFCRDEEIKVSTNLGRELREHRDMFISAKAKFTFSGYAFSQLKRIKGHRSFLLNPPKKKPERKDFKLPDHTLIPKDQLEAVRATIKVKLDSWNIGLDAATDSEKIHIQGQILDYLTEFSASFNMEVEDANWLAAARSIGLDENFIYTLQREREYESAKRYWDQYQTWEKNRNVDRAKLEAQFGYDAKHAAHLVRLLKMGKEILETGKVNVWRGPSISGPNDSEELMSVRNGKHSYDELIEWTDKEIKSIDSIYTSQSYVIPKSSDQVAIDNLCVNLVEEFLNKGVTY